MERCRCSPLERTLQRGCRPWFQTDSDHSPLTRNCEGTGVHLTERHHAVVAAKADILQFRY